MSGAGRRLAEPLDFEELLACLAADHPGSLAHLAGDLDLMDVCRLAAACHPEGRVRVRQGDSDGVLSYRGAVLVHAAVDGLAGAAALARLRQWDDWRFESLAGAADLRAGRRHQRLPPARTGGRPRIC
jgi:hypothetical protein